MLPLLIHLKPHRWLSHKASSPKMLTKDANPSLNVGRKNSVNALSNANKHALLLKTEEFLLRAI
jgi:hypothetical protein